MYDALVMKVAHALGNLLGNDDNLENTETVEKDLQRKILIEANEARYLVHEELVFSKVEMGVQRIALKRGRFWDAVRYAIHDVINFVKAIRGRVQKVPPKIDFI